MSKEAQNVLTHYHDIIRSKIVRAMADETSDGFMPTPLEDFSTHQKRVRLQYGEMYKQHKNLMDKGIEIAAKENAWPSPKSLTSS